VNTVGSSITSAAHRKTTWRQFTEEQAHQPQEPNIRIGIAATFTANSLIPFLGGYLIDAGLKPSIKLAPYNQIFQACLDFQTHFGAECEVAILLFRLEDIILDEMTAFLHGHAHAVQRASSKIQVLASAIKTLRQGFGGTIIVSVPLFPSTLPVHTLSLENALGLGTLHRSLTAQFLEDIRDIRGVRLLDLDAVQRECGLSNSFDARQWYLYRQPFTDLFLLQAGTLLGRMVQAIRRSPKKCIVLDCDNTLWGGIVGEDGIGGIGLGDEFPGTAYRDFQRVLLYLREQGILLALASKNNEADVWEVFEKHSGMLLKREHISAWRINWTPKSENISKIAQALNIGLDSLVFIDDNLMEIEQMRSAQPEVQSVLLPEDPADILSHIRSNTFFDQFEVTQEDRQRTDMMRAEKEREVLSTSLTKEDFRRSLALRLTFFRTQSEDLDRITQLINKTNQFNLTTIRRSLDEVSRLANSPNHRIFGLRVSDKFGEYGLTGVVIVEVSDDQVTWVIDTLLLSCRVLGRGVETSLLTALARDAKTEGVSHLKASFIPTQKNAPALSFLPDHGFERDESGNWQIAVLHIPEICSSVTLVHESKLPAESIGSLRQT
jgi:FkbH-like protein